MLEKEDMLTEEEVIAALTTGTQHGDNWPTVHMWLLGGGPELKEDAAAMAKRLDAAGLHKPTGLRGICG